MLKRQKNPRNYPWIFVENGKNRKYYKNIEICACGKRFPMLFFLCKRQESQKITNNK